MRKPFDTESKVAFLAAVKVHLAKGRTINSAYQQTKAEFQQEGKPVPQLSMCYGWLRPENPESARITNLRKMIRRRGLTYREVAIRMGIPTKSVSSAARNGINTIGLAQRYAAALGCPFCKVMGKGRDYGCK